MSTPTPEDVPVALPPDQQGWKGNPSADTGGLARLAQELRSLKAQVAELRGAAPLRAAGVRVAPEGMTIDSNLAITGTLSLPAGIIDNDALTSPVRFDAGFQDNDGPLNLTASEAELARASFTVPAGFTSAFVVGYASIGILNPTGAASSIGGRVYIDRPSGPVWGPRRFQQALAGADAACYPYKQTMIRDLAGGETVTLRLVGLNTGPNWGMTQGGASLNWHAYFTR